ncbi:hypothetical protein [Gracilimonas mengyeensis]|uniref:Uncharacterized protein n=1 Tax=Gracilimonas mengyeensis TaxID=1302730 RepID=A0A521C0C2_9BACT|nr:hypothetical protein [Gracilimonas mengyeensis]SMO52899.1 hypothetical protein SAMN06265219_10443 [Gracilimonas mengyeensis]
MNTKLASLLIVSLFFINGCFDFGCMLGGGYETTSYGTDLYIFESEDDLSNWNNETVFNYSSIDAYPDIYYGIRDIRTTADGTASFYFDHLPIFINYGFNEQNSVDLNIYSNLSDYYIHDRNIDLLPLSSSTVFAIFEFSSLDDPYNEGVSHPMYYRESVVLDWDLSSSHLDTLAYSETTFRANNKFGYSMFHSPRYDVDKNAYFISARNDYLITSDSTNTNFYYNDFFSEAFLVKYNAEQARLDSLISVEPSKTNLMVRGNSILVYGSDSFRVISTDGKELTPETTGKKFVMGIDGESITFNNGRDYLRVSDNKTIRLVNIISDIDYAFPSEDKVAILSNDRQTLSLLDVETEELIRQIQVEDIEGIPSTPSKRSTYTFRRPLFDRDSNLKFILMDHHHYDDPDEPCD